MELSPDTRDALLASIKRFFAEELDEDIGDLKAARVLEFCVAEVGASVYNQAIADARTFLEDRVADLDGALYEAEFGYWKRG